MNLPSNPDGSYREAMPSKQDVREFLMSRRAAVAPERAGVPVFSGDRRVPGLRREEVAALSGVSVDYYTRLEKGNIVGVSDTVLNAVARALQLTPVEREHLLDLARSANRSPVAAVNPGVEPALRPSMQRTLDSMNVPAIVQTPSQDIVAANLLARAMYAPLFDGAEQPNFAFFNYLDPRSRDFFVDWPWARRTAAAIMRFEMGRNPANARLNAVIEELTQTSALFVEDWARNDVHEHRTGVKSFRHPQIGVLEVVFDVFETPGEPDLKMVTYSAPSGSETAEKLVLLASWASSNSIDSH